MKARVLVAALGMWSLGTVASFGETKDVCAQYKTAGDCATKGKATHCAWANNKCATATATQKTGEHATNTTQGATGEKEAAPSDHSHNH